jgi:hypothetical protein
MAYMLPHRIVCPDGLLRKGSSVVHAVVRAPAAEALRIITLAWLAL